MKNIFYKGLNIERALFDLRRGLPVILRINDEEYFLWAGEFFNPENVNIYYEISTAGLNDTLPNSLKENKEALLSLIKKTELLPSIYVTNIFDDKLSNIVCNISIEDLFDINDNIEVSRITKCHLPTSYSENCYFYSYRVIPSFYEYYALAFGNVGDGRDVNIRLHAQCFTGDLLGSLRCDCGGQLKKALGYFGKQDNGVLIYIPQEGRNIGLLNKMRAYDLQHKGMDTAEANLSLGFNVDERDYKACSLILKDLGVSNVNILTNNKTKIKALEDNDIRVSSRREHYAEIQKFNEKYIKVKQEKLNHIPPEITK